MPGIPPLLDAVKYYLPNPLDMPPIEGEAVEKKKKDKDPDILARSTSYEWYRNFMIASNIGYKMMMESFQTYMSYFRKDKE